MILYLRNRLRTIQAFAILKQINIFMTFLMILIKFSGNAENEADGTFERWHKEIWTCMHAKLCSILMFEKSFPAWRRKDKLKAT